MTKPKFKSTTEDCPVVDESFFQVSGLAERLFNIVSYYRPAPQSFFLAGSSIAAPIMPHYVNIAWGIIFWPCLFVCGPGRLFDPTKEWAMCRTSVGTKSMTKNKPEGHGCEGSVLVFTRCLKSDGLTVLLFEFLLLNCFELFQVFKD